jgi:hypothetical protein
VLLLCCLIFTLSLIQLIDYGVDEKGQVTTRFEDSIKGNPETFALGLFTGACGLSLVFLLVYHVNLIRRGETTNESIRAVYRRRINPFARGFCENLSHVLWAPLPPSQLDYLLHEVTPSSIPGIGDSRAQMRSRRNFQQGTEGNQEWSPSIGPAVQPSGEQKRSSQMEHSYQASVQDPESFSLETKQLLNHSNTSTQAQ